MHQIINRSVVKTQFYINHASHLSGHPFITSSKNTNFLTSPPPPPSAKINNRSIV